MCAVPFLPARPVLPILSTYICRCKNLFFPSMKDKTATALLLPVHVVLNGKGEGEVDDIVHAGDVETSSSDISGHKQRHL